jgi:ATP-binding cassette subfamily F protein uup
MRRGPPARTSKSKARIQRYHDLVKSAPEAGQEDLSFSIPCLKRLGDRVINLLAVSKSFGERVLFDHLDLELGKGERLGIIGPNGAGKTSLLRICLGQLAPDRGQVQLGPTVNFSYIDQARQDLDPAKTVLEELGQGNDHVFVGGRSIRLESYLESFLFPSRLFRTAVGELSGGEKNRLLIAKLLAIGGNVLVLDEPTNDLDLMTLRVLEEALIAFEGSAIIVSHDRWFLDRVATKILHIGSDGRHRLHHGDLSDLLEQLAGESRQAQAEERARSTSSKTREPKAKERKLSTREREELGELPDKIHAAEEELEALDKQLADPSLYSADSSKAKELAAERKLVDERLQQLYARWEELESIAELT